MPLHSEKETDLSKLKSAFKESAAISGWILIETIQRNSTFLDEHPELLSEAYEYLNRGLDCGENHRMANNHFVTGTRKIQRQHPELISTHPEIVEALSRLTRIAKEKIDPLWDKYSEEY